MADEELGTNLGAHMQRTKYFVDFLRSFPTRELFAIHRVHSLPHRHQTLAPALVWSVLFGFTSQVHRNG